MMAFTSVDREVYDSADRSVFTVTDPDQNLRSSVSESPDGRDAKNIIRGWRSNPVCQHQVRRQLGWNI